MVTDPAEGGRITVHFQGRIALYSDMALLLIKSYSERHDQLMQSFGKIEPAGLLWVWCYGDLLKVIDQICGFTGLLL